MAIITPSLADPLTDRRQSELAMFIRRGTMRLFRDMNISSIPELPLADGRRADIVSLLPNGEIWITEIKSSIEDFRTDKKWHNYRQYCDRLFFASHIGVPTDIFPSDCGLITADNYGAAILRDAPLEKAAPATRKALTLRFARNSAARLARLEMAGYEVLEGDVDL